jgi:hypothetical protein
MEEMQMAAKEQLTHERLHDLIDYDPGTGIFRRKIRRSDLRKDEAVRPERLREVLEYDQQHASSGKSKRQKDRPWGCCWHCGLALRPASASWMVNQGRRT